ncbi:MAG: hypothetical protein ACXWEJ_08175, partial [Actinomycetota bacterium]
MRRGKLPRHGSDTSDDQTGRSPADTISSSPSRSASKRFLPLEEARPPETCLYTNTPDGEFVLDRLGPIVVGSPC